MATSSSSLPIVSLSRLLPCSASAKSRPNPRKPLKTRPSRKNPNPRIQSRTTNTIPFTYTRLPLKDDFSSSSEDQTSPEITIYDSIPPRRDPLSISDDGEDISDDDDDVIESFIYSGSVEDEEESESESEEEDDMEDDKVEKERGLPAVMRCFDRAKIYVKAGDGGNGVVAFRREKFVPLGGPSGGDGGRGGNVYIEADPSMNSLLPFRKSVHFRAGRGGHGQGRNQGGAKGEDVVVKVAPGTVVREAPGEGEEEGAVVMELVKPGQRSLLLPGGRGGKGNASFKSGNNKVPRLAENGELGPEIGCPNAGKSTLLSAVSAAQPTIANYPFTTLLPNLGVVSLDYDATMVVADLPGLLEGAHRGYGLGHEFLRHTERCSVLVLVVDGSGQQPDYEFDAVCLELELFSPELAEKPYIVAYNKMDLPEATEKWESFEEKLVSRGIRPFCISAANRQGTHELICAAYELLRKSKSVENTEAWMDPANLNYVADMISRQRNTPMNEFEITHDSSSNTWNVIGAGIHRYVDSLKRFQHALEACGVNRSLIKLGVKEGDIVIVGEGQLDPSNGDSSTPAISINDLNPDCRNG
ncbi:hypothetical protein QJS10_CPB04g00781 [Acorus calamus]|uniref:Uncharacterized protein n=1 Tax=Acorus calamus TaxID=4465 RepID=A0AAV9F1A8_ACOCL|nr:hypothetical protein QJS10_CPB04g00781 [Acorus calamus]